MRSLLRSILALILIGLGAPVWAQDCTISEFQQRDVGALSSAQYYSLVSEMTEREWNDRRTAASGSGAYGPYSGEASYSQAQQTAREQLRRLNISQHSNETSSWARSTLTEAGLSGYLACLGGLNIGLTALDEQTAVLIIRSRPRPAESFQRPTVEETNVSNRTQIVAQVNGAEWGPAAVDLAIPIRRRDPYQAATISVAAGSISKLAYWPAFIREHRFRIPSRTCSSGGNLDTRECVIASNAFTVRRSGDVEVALLLPALQIVETPGLPAHDPHRQAFVQIWCGTSASAEYIGQVSVARFEGAWSDSIRCRGERGRPLHVRAVVIPRGTSDVIIDGNGSILARELP